jgi:hypothetical protein
MRKVSEMREYRGDIVPFTCLRVDLIRFDFVTERLHKIRLHFPYHGDPKGRLPSDFDGNDDKETANSWRSFQLFLAEWIVMGLARDRG